MSTSIVQLDRYYADQLGCTPEDLCSGRVVVVANESVSAVRFARGIPLAVYALSGAGGTVISVMPRLADAARAAIADHGPSALDDSLCDAIEQALDPLVDAQFWFRGSRLFCSRETFVDCSVGEACEVTGEDDVAADLHQKWGGPVFGQVVDSRVVSWATVKPLSDVAWDLSIQTLTDFRGRGYAKSAVSAAVRHILDSGRLAAWGCDRNNAASLRTAQALGFQDYALDFGCVEQA